SRADLRRCLCATSMTGTSYAVPRKRAASSSVRSASAARRTRSRRSPRRHGRGTWNPRPYKNKPRRGGVFSFWKSRTKLVCAARSAAAAVEALLGERDEREDLGLLRRFFLRVAVGDELRKLGYQR